VWAPSPTRILFFYPVKILARYLQFEQSAGIGKLLAFEDPKETHYWDGSIPTFFLVTLIVHFCPAVQPFKRKPIIFVSTYTLVLPKSTKKDTFHNVVFVLTK
jgi:hypothetical protein